MAKKASKKRTSSRKTSTKPKKPIQGAEQKEHTHSHERENPQDRPLHITQEIFEERWEAYMNQLQEAVENTDVPVALAIVVDPELGPLVFRHGHIYEQGRLAAMLYGNIKNQIDEDLSADLDPRKGQASQ